jgi:hypothetical protein
MQHAFQWELRGRDLPVLKAIRKNKELQKYFEKADFIDVKIFEGNTTLPSFHS